MYLAPLTYDRFFKKVFDDDFIAKSFLEDFLDVEITEFEKAKLEHRITDDAALIRFDYRCKIKGQYVIIDMQQWYKQDIVKRFYTYHCANTVVQLEKIPWLKMPIPPTTTEGNMDAGETTENVSAETTNHESEIDGNVSAETTSESKSNHKQAKNKVIKNYEYITPVTTIIWMVHDSLGYKKDRITFTTGPDAVFDLFLNKDLWQPNQFEKLLEQRKKVLYDIGW